jgi:phage I-like protein
MKQIGRTFAIFRSQVEGDKTWFHVVPPVGEYPTTIIGKGGKPVKGQTLVIDAAASAAIMAAFRADVPDESAAGILVDREHLSLAPDGDSTAMAWMKDLRAEDDGLWARLDLTPRGAQAVAGGEYKFRSPVFDLEDLGNGRWRPVRLAGCALTNVPHFTNLSPAAAAREGQSEISIMDIKTLATKLGLDPEKATEQDVLAAIDALLQAKTDGVAAQAAAKTAQDELAAARVAQRKQDCDAFISAHKAQIQDEAPVRAQFMQDPDATKALFGAFRAAPAQDAPTPRSLHRAATSNPGARDDAAAASVTRGAERNAAIARVAAREGIGRREAVSIARRETPDLWKD